MSSWESPGRKGSLPPARESAVNEQDAVAAARAGDTGVGLVWHGVRNGPAPPDDEGDHELVGSQHVGHALSWLTYCASLRPAKVPASTKKSDPGLA